jgi:flagellin-specific chaperone FliS
MHDPIKYLKSKGFNTQYPSMCVEFLKQQTFTWTPLQFVQEVERLLTGADATTSNVGEMGYFETKYSYFYVVQNLLLANKNGEILEDDSLIIKSYNQALDFIKMHKTALDEEARERGLTVGNNIRGGSKTEKALNIFTDMIRGFDVNDDQRRSDIINEYMLQLDMNRSGALTYYHSAKKRYITQK